MKFLLMLTLFFVGCDKIASLEGPVKQPETVSQTTEVKEYPKLAWSEVEPNGEWTKAIYDELAELPEIKEGTIKTPCKKLGVKDCAAQLLSAIAYAESKFNNNVIYKECSKDKKKYKDGVYVKSEDKYCKVDSHGRPITSRGLFQISIESAKSYKCNVQTDDDLHYGIKNARCAVKILAKNAMKSGTLIDGERGGASAYWGPARTSSDSFKPLLAHMGKF